MSNEKQMAQGQTTRRQRILCAVTVAFAETPNFKNNVTTQERKIPTLKSVAKQEQVRSAKSF